jgi:hypothetical protein
VKTVSQGTTGTVSLCGNAFPGGKVLPTFNVSAKISAAHAGVSAPNWGKERRDRAVDRGKLPQKITTDRSHFRAGGPKPSKPAWRKIVTAAVVFRGVI